jgi:hypothetical protein
MQVKDLIEILQRKDPEAYVVTSGSDHSYDEVSRCVAMKAEMYRDGFMTEYWEKTGLSEEDSFVIDVVVL